MKKSLMVEMNEKHPQDEKTGCEAVSADAPGYEAHRVMTPEEYEETPIIGWHMVCRDVDGFGNIGVRYTTPFTQKSKTF